LCDLQTFVQLILHLSWCVMALVATFGSVVAQPRVLQVISKIFTDLSMSWLEGFARRGWSFGVPSPAPHMSFEEPPAMEGVQFAAGELYQLLLPGLSCAAIPLIVVGLWTVLGWLGRAVWFTGWMLSWIGWLLSGCPCPKRSGSLVGGFGHTDSPQKNAASKPWASSSAVLGGAGLVAGAAVRPEPMTARPTSASPSPDAEKQPMPRDFGASDLLKLAIQEDEFLQRKAFSGLKLEEPGPDFNNYHFDRRIRSGKFRGYRYDELLTKPDYVAHIYQSGYKPGMEAIKAYYNFAMKHQIAVSAGSYA